jgi:hypothetical protein
VDRHAGADGLRLEAQRRDIASYITTSWAADLPDHHRDRHGDQQRGQLCRFTTASARSSPASVLLTTTLASRGVSHGAYVDPIVHLTQGV